MTLPIPAPLQLCSASVAAGWVDDNGHLNEWAYLLIFGGNADAFLRLIRADDYRAAGHSLFTAETHLRCLREVKLGQRLRLTLQLLGHDSERLHVLHEMFVPGVGCAATAEQMLVHVCTRSGRVEPFGRPVSDRLAEIAVAHERLLVPDYVGQSIRPPPQYGTAGVPARSGWHSVRPRSGAWTGDDLAGDFGVGLHVSHQVGDLEFGGGQRIPAEVRTAGGGYPGDGT